MRYHRNVGSLEIELECDSRFEQMAQALLEKMETLNLKGPALKNGSRIQYGWSLLTLRAEDSGLRVCEPDFDGDALQDFHTNLDATFEILGEQAEVLRRTGLTGLDVRFSDEVFVRGDALESPNLFLKRQSPNRAGDSGWYVGNSDDLDVRTGANPPEVVRVFELLRRRRPLLKVLTIPTDYVVTIEREEITGVLDRGGNNLWIGNQ